MVRVSERLHLSRLLQARTAGQSAPTSCLISLTFRFSYTQNSQISA